MHEEANLPELTQMLHAAGKGDNAARNRFAELVYDDLKRTAQQVMRREGNQTLQPTALVNEAFMRLLSQGEVQKAPSRAYFFAAAAQAMRRILVDAARRRKSLKRGGDYTRQPLDRLLDVYESQNLDLLSLDEGLSELARLSPRQAEVVHLRWFVQLSVKEIAELLSISLSTVEQDWRIARAYLKRHLSVGDEPEI